MSRIDALIAEFCPNGVEFKTIESFVSRPINVRWAEHADAEFHYIDLTSVDRATHAIVETSAITSENAPSRAQQIVREGDVIFGTTRPMLKRYAVIPHKYDGHICSTGFCVLRPDNKIVLTNFLFHLLGTDDFYAYVEANQRGASYPAVPDSVVKNFRLPVPPLEVQREIVKVLDTFTKLEAELEAELEARRRQYKYYRDALLSFAELTDADASKQASKQATRWMMLSEVGKFIRGRRFTKADYADDGIDVIHYGEIYTHYSTSATSVLSRVRADMQTTLRYAKPGDVVITDVGETVEDVGKAVAWLGAGEVAIHDHCYAFRHSMNPKFVSYCMQTTPFLAQKAKYVARTKVNTLLMEGFAKIKIPVPPIEEQARIVAILDQFDTLVNDLSIGLPAELKARRKQYAHYRDRLLSFREAA